MARKNTTCCRECSRKMTKDEVALSRKLIGRHIEDCFCIECLAEYMEISVTDLRVKIQEFKEQGCALFL